MKVMQKYLFCLSFLLIINCTTQNFVPPRPLHKGEDELRVSFNFSLNKFNTQSVQFSAYHGITDNDVIGTSLTNFFFPNHITFAHYWDNQNNFPNIQIHCNNLLACNYNPTYEIDLGYSYYYEHIYNSIKLGVGYYATPLMLRLNESVVTKNKLVPIIGYHFQYKLLTADVQCIPGLTAYYIRYYKDEYTKYVGPPLLPELVKENSPYVFSHAQIDTLLDVNGTFKFKFKSGDTLIVAERNPYIDCISCGFDQDNHSAYLASTKHNVYWVYWKNWHDNDQGPEMLELNLESIINNFENGGDLELVEDKNLTDKTIGNRNFLLHDIFFSIGRVEYQNH